MPAVTIKALANTSMYNDPSPVTPASNTSNGSSLPYGISASQMGLSLPDDSGKKSWKPIVIWLVVIIVVLAGIGIGYVEYQNAQGYGTKTVPADGFSYNVTYNKKPKQLALNGKDYQLGTDKNGKQMLLFVGKSVNSIGECYASEGSTISIIDTPTIEGKQHNLCYSHVLNAYVMNFTHGDTWYYITVFALDKGQILDEDTAKMVISSVQILS
jgi:hypothetical protein